MTDLATSLGPLALKNPVLVAAGTFGYGLEFREFFDLKEIGGIITKTLTLAPRDGNPAPRVVETPSGMLNSVGLQNVGVEAFIKEKWPGLRDLGVPVIVSIAGFSTNEFVQAADHLTGIPIAALELYLACPNVAHEGSQRCFSQNLEETREVVSGVKRKMRVPVFAKLTAEVAD